MDPVFLAPADLLLLLAVGVFIGALAVTSGGGATAGVPLMLLLGYPPAASVIAVSFGLLASFVTGIVSYRRLPPPSVRIPWYAWPLAVAGAAAGAHLFLSIDPQTLRVLIVAMLLASLVLSLVLVPRRTQDHQPVSRARQHTGTAVLFLLCVYCGFFGAGFGTFVIVALIYFYGYSFVEAASAGTRVALVVGGVSMLTFLVKGAVVFRLGVPLAIGCSVGGYLGASLAQRAGDRFVRTVFLASTLGLTLKLGYDLLR